MYRVTMIRSVSFVGMLVLSLVAQKLWPSRAMDHRRWQFMASNVGIVLFNNLVIGLLPIIPYQMAVVVKEQSWGLLNAINDDSPVILVIKVLMGIVLLDLVIYFQHRFFHTVDFLWRLHSMHHVDPMLDVTSGLRFHPLEIVISNFIKVGAIVLIGIMPLAVVIFEIGLNLFAMFNHSNIAIPPKAETIISKLLITPALHTIHHSKIWKETNANFGFSVPWWDQLFGTFIAKGKYDQRDIRIGTVPMPPRKWQLFPGMLLQPFMKNIEESKP